MHCKVKEIAAKVKHIKAFYILAEITTKYTEACSL